jgi:hypothetical protein
VRLPIQGEDKASALFPFDVSGRPPSMPAPGALMEVIGFSAPATAAYPCVPARQHELGVEL